MATATLDMPTPTTNLNRSLLRGTDRIILTGFMGSGKTTAGRALAAQLGWKFLDLDHLIESREGRSVPAIFAEEGEVYFRKAETAALVSVLGERHVVLALGGGAPETLGNRLLLEQTPRTTVVHLTAPFETLVARCLAQPNATERPVLADLKSAEERFKARQRHYERIARVTIVTEGLDLEETVAAVIERLR